MAAKFFIIEKKTVKLKQIHRTAAAVPAVLDGEFYNEEHTARWLNRGL
jgi:hypothetical protein